MIRVLIIQKMNPDPAAHLILADEEQGYQYSQGAISAKGNGNHWIFPHSKTLEMDHSQPFMVVGIKFRVGSLYSLNLSTPQREMDKVINIDINEIVQSESFHAAELLAKAVDYPQQACDMMDELLTGISIKGK